MSPDATSYGAETCGLIVGYVFGADGRGREVDSATATAWLREHQDNQGGGEFIWLHFNAANAAAEGWLKENFTLPEAFYEALREESRSSRIERADDALIAVVNDVIYDFLFVESNQVSTLWASADSRRLVSVRRQPLQSADRLRMAVRAGVSFTSPADLLAHLLRDQADILIAIMRKTAAKVDDIEDTLLAGRLNAKRISLGTLRRDLVRLQRLLAPEPASLFRLLNNPPPWLAEVAAQDLRQSTEEFSLVLRDLAILQERIKLLQEEIAASINERTGRTVFVLTAVTVLALPVNMVAGLFGMNVGGIPHAQDQYGFWTVIGYVAAFTALAAWLLFRGNKD